MIIPQPTYHNKYGFKTIDLISKVLEQIKDPRLGYSIGKTIEYLLDNEYQDKPVYYLEMIKWHIDRIKPFMLDNDASLVYDKNNFINEIESLEEYHINESVLLSQIIKLAIVPTKDNCLHTICTIRKIMQDYV